VLEAILDQLEQVIACDACAIFLVTDHVLQMAASRHMMHPADAPTMALDPDGQPDLWALLGSHQPSTSADWLQAEPFAGLVGPLGLQAALLAPLAYQARPVGLLLVGRRGADVFVGRDAQLAMAFADQAAMTIENARLYAEARRRAQQLEAVSQVGRRVTSIVEMDQLLAEVVRLIREQLGYYHVHVFLVEGGSNQIVLRAASGHAGETLKRQPVRLKIGQEGLTGWVAAAGEPVLCNDVSREPRYHPHALLPKTQAELAVPLRVGDVVVGVLDVQSERRDAFHADDAKALQILADQVAIAIENAHLFERTRRQMEAMRALHDISLDITAHLEQEEVLAAVLEQATHFLGAQGSSLGIVNRAAGVVRLIATHNLPAEYRGVALAIGEGASGRVVQTGEAVIVNDYAHWDARSPVFRNSPFDAIISVPLRRDGEVFGALSVVDSGARRPFKDQDAQLLSLFADLAGIALRNAELYSQVRLAGEALEHKVQARTGELARAQVELAQKAGELRKLLQVTVHVQEEERTRIARDLHDGSNQLIAGTLYEIQAAQESIVAERHGVALQKLEIAKGLLRNIEAENRRIISGLRPTILDAQGLVAALRWHASNFQKLYGLACAVRVRGEPTRLPPEVEVAVYRIMQEALNNVAAHAQAQSVNIQVSCGPDQWRVTIRDDGIGFDYHRALVVKSGQMGLIGMQERAQSIGGQIEVDSQPGQGTRLTLSVPIQDRPAPPGE
jgi:signal transduction histidine kinase